jgi:hypothetical protein
MSIKSIVSISILSCALVVSIVFLNHRILLSKSSHLDVDKIEKFQKLLDHKLGHQNNTPTKVGLPLFVEVTSNPTSNQNEFIGKINLQRFDIDQIFYSWTLPNGSTLTSGDLSGSLSTRNDSDFGVISFSIVVNNLDPSINQNIILSAWIVLNGKKIGASGNAATLPEETYEHKVHLFESRSLASKSFKSTATVLKKIQF